MSLYGIIDYETQAWSEKVANNAKQKALTERIDQHKVRLQMQRLKEEVAITNAYLKEMKNGKTKM